MPTTRSALSKQQEQHKGHHSVQQHVHELPSEILSYIFVLCNSMWLLDVKEEEFACQAIIPAVCRRWRKIALETPTLWTRITLTDGPPYSRSALFLSRSGSVAPLDIDLDMTESFWSDTEEGTLEECTQLAKDAFAFIAKHGGIPSRWQRFWIQTDIFQAHLAAMDFLQSSPMPALQYLEMQHSGPYEFDEEDSITYEDAVKSSPKLLFRDAPPQLRTAKLAGIPNPYLFGHSAHPQLVGLTRLELEFAERLPNLEDLHKMLAASSSELLVLCLDSKNVGEPHSGPRTKALGGRLAKIHFPKLRALSFSLIAFPEWDLGILEILNAPNLTTLRIKTDGDRDRDEHCLQMLNLLAHGPDKKNPKAHFPALAHFSCDIMSDPTDDLGVLLAACPNISSLSLPSASRLTVLLKQPWLAPELRRLRASIDSVSQLKKLVAARHKAGIPLTVIETYGQLANRDTNQLKKHVETVIANTIYDERERVDPMSW